MASCSSCTVLGPSSICMRSEFLSSSTAAAFCTMKSYLGPVIASPKTLPAVVSCPFLPSSHLTRSPSTVLLAASILAFLSILIHHLASVMVQVRLSSR